MREFDWSSHPLGLPENWPHSLRIAIRIMLSSRFAMWMGWGAEFFFFCNDAYAPTLGIKQDRALGRKASDVWAEIWKDVGPRAESVVRTGEATWDESLLLFLERSGYPEETYHTFSYSPLPNDDGLTGGLLCVVTEETERVIGERRLALLRDLGADLAAVKVERELFQCVERRLRERSQDLPFALIFLLSEDGKTARLACAHHVEWGSLLAPATTTVGEGETWPLTSVLEKGTPILVDDPGGRFGNVTMKPWDKPPRSALVMPLAQQGQERPAGFLVAGLNPYRPPDRAYRGFLDLLAGQIVAGIASVRAYEAERRRAEVLAELDRAKTTFFSNVSHEFRTPLTLLLGPLEEMAGKPAGKLPEQDRALLTMAHRNGLRLLKLVNSLLDFARIEAGRSRARFDLTDMGAFTADLASSFRSAMGKAGLDFIVECPPLPEPVLIALDAEFRFEYLNAEARNRHGLAPEEYLGRSLWEASPATVGTPLETNFRRVLTEKTPVLFEYFYDPGKQWFEINANPMTGGRLGIFFRDVTESKRASEALRESEERFRNIFENAATGIAITDMEGRFEQCNPAYCAILGYAEEELRRMEFPRLIHPDDVEENMVALHRLQGGELASFEIENRYVRKDGIPVWVLKYGSILRNDAGEPAHLLALVTDITERRLANAALREAKEAAEAANNSKDRFLAVLSHELRTPLTPVLMVVSELEHDPDLRADVKEDLAMMRRNIELETKLIDDLLDLSRITSGKLVLNIEPVDLNEAVHQVGGICHASLHERGIRLEVIHGSGMGMVKADPARLQQVLWNVLKNAIKFTPEGGTIQVTTRCLEAGRSEVRIQDSGIGIHPDVLPRIFDAFEQGNASVTRQFGGLGLGLAISRALADLHGGSIRAESGGAGQGSTFIVELPGDEPPVAASLPDAEPESAGTTGGIRVLLVEDHADTLRMLTRLLRGAGFEVSAFSGVASAIAAVEREPFDVLVSDLGLPDGSGCDIMRHVRGAGNLPGIGMSGFGMDEDLRRSREAGFTEHLVKPISIPHLIAAIRRVTENAGRAGGE